MLRGPGEVPTYMLCSRGQGGRGDGADLGTAAQTDQLGELGRRMGCIVALLCGVRAQEDAGS